MPCLLSRKQPCVRLQERARNGQKGAREILTGSRGGEGMKSSLMSLREEGRAWTPVSEGGGWGLKEEDWV